MTKIVSFEVTTHAAQYQRCVSWDDPKHPIYTMVKPAYKTAVLVCVYDGAIEIGQELPLQLLAQTQVSSNNDRWLVAACSILDYAFSIDLVEVAP